MSIPMYTAYNDFQIPQLGMGTYKLKGKMGVDAIAAALEIGYRYLDTAYNYENEGTVGEAIRQSSVNREDIQVASKLPGRYHDYESALTTIEESLYRTGLNYFDLYLIHWPNPKQDQYVDAWKALIEAKKRGWVKEIGVSNFTQDYIERLIAETGEKPVLNQIELHPYFEQAELLAYHQSQGIITQAWCPLGRANEKVAESVLELPKIVTIAQKYEKTPAQVILRWHLQRGVMAIPKSSKPERLAENFDVFDFELTDEELATISSYSRADGRLANQDPEEHEEF